MFPALGPLIHSKDDVTVRVLSTFKRLISEGALVAGARLPSERELAEKFQVSRSSLRQALKVLEIMGVISQRVGDGTYLNASAPTVLDEPMEFLILLNGLTSYELMEARIIVEPELAARAATRATEDDLAVLRSEMALMEKAETNADRSYHDILFHSAIFQAAGNRVCTLMFTVVHHSLRQFIELTSQLVPPRHTLNLHQKIYSAIRRRNPEEARKRMAEHLQDADSLLARAHSEERSSRLQNRITELSIKPAAKAATAPRKRKS
jgi:GntR family transcriptional regulator, transcriptional repressor for pyruvate dehydrogenase complex